jgi:phenylalanyl-tRNA synthetase beta chain
MTIARSSKRHVLRSEASNRFERGVDPSLALRAAARYVAILSESAPEMQWLANPLDVRGTIPTPPTIELRGTDIGRLLGVEIANDDVTAILSGLGFSLVQRRDYLQVTAPTSRLDVRTGTEGRADVIEEIARIYSYRRLPQHNPSWPEFGGLDDRQRLRRRLLDVVVDAGALEVWTPTLGSDADFDLLDRDQPRVRVTNPLAADESVLRATQITGLVRAWAKNYERGLGDVILAEFGVVFTHPSATSEPRMTKGGAGGTLTLALPRENERVTIVLGRPDDDAKSAVALWSVVARRLGLDDVVVRSVTEAPRGLHPTRAAALVDRESGALLGYVGEVDGDLVDRVTSGSPLRRLGLIDIDVDVLADPHLATRSPSIARVPSRFPSAVLDLAFVTPQRVHADDLAYALRHASDLVEEVTLFDVYQGPGLVEGTRSLAFNVRLNSAERTLNENEVTQCRAQLIDVAASLGAVLR